MHEWKRHCLENRIFRYLNKLQYLVQKTRKQTQFLYSFYLENLTFVSTANIVKVFIIATLVGDDKMNLTCYFNGGVVT